MEYLKEFFVRKHATESGLCFVLMPFSSDLQAVYEFVIKPFIESQGMQCLRADEIYGARPIMVDIWSGIQRAEVVIADLTARNPNVMYELGLCHALWKKMVLITQKVEDVPFDLKGFRLIPYEPSIGGAQRLKEELGRTIQALREENTEEGQITLFAQTPVVQKDHPGVSATVEAVAKEYMLLRLGDGRAARMEIGDFSWTFKIRDLTTKFKIGEPVHGVLLSQNKSPCKFSIKHQIPDPWPTFQKKHPVGSSFEGRVLNVTEFGIFVELEPRFNGLVPKRTLPASETFSEGEVVRVVIRGIDPVMKNVLLGFNAKIESGSLRRAAS